MMQSFSEKEEYNLAAKTCVVSWSKKEEGFLTQDTHESSFSLFGLIPCVKRVVSDFLTSIIIFLMKSSRVDVKLLSADLHMI